jgi:hypothetical protein
MREYLVARLAAIATPPPLPAHYLNQMKRKFKNLERYISQVSEGSEVADQVEQVSGYWFRNPYRELPVYFRSMVGKMNETGWRGEPSLSQRIEETQQAFQLKNLGFDTMRGVLKRMVRLENDRSEYTDFFKSYYGFIKEYPDTLRELRDDYRDDSDPQWEKRHESILENFQIFRMALDALYKYVILYLDFARQMNAFILRRDQQIDAYVNGNWGREIELRPPHKSIEILFHATTNVPSILTTGFKTRSQLGGDLSAALGGGPDDVISFTADIRIARAIVDALRHVVAIARGEMDFQDVLRLAHEDGVESSVFDNTKRDYGRNDPKKLAFEAYRTFLFFTMVRYNPAFFGVRVEHFENVDPQNIGIIAAKIDMVQTTEYLREMEEFRVPLSGILSVKRVPY